MSSGIYLVAALATLSGQAWAQPHRGPFGISVGVDQFPSYAPEITSTKCVSKWALTSCPANTQTHWTTHHNPCTTTSTCTYTYTTTPSDVTTTLTSTCRETVTDDCSTATATETDTTTETTTTTETETTTTCTITTTTWTSTSTIPTPRHFIPVQSSFPGSKFVEPRRSEAEDDEDLDERNAVQHIDLSTSRHRYPQGVYCEEFHEQCSIIYTTITTTETATPCTSTTCTTTTCTSTVTPWAVSVTTTTETDTDTVTCSTTTTDTATLTITETSSTTVYGACATNNFANRGPDNGFFAGINGDATEGKEYANVANAYDCCVSAITDSTANIQAFSFYPQAGICLGFYREGTCPLIKPTDTVRRSTKNQGQIVGNGPCGKITGYSV